MTGWDESEHPRDPDGQFRDKTWADWSAEVRKAFPGLALDMHESGSGGAVLDRIVVPVNGPFGLKREQGVGSRVLGMITEEADRRGQTIHLTPGPVIVGQHMVPVDKPRLEQFYRRFGFEPDPDRPGAMIRRPQQDKTWIERVVERLPSIWTEDDLESSDAYLASVFGEPALRGSGRSEPHPTTGWPIKVGRHRRLVKPAAGEAETPARWTVDDYGEMDDQKLYPDRDVAEEPIGYVYRGMSLGEWEQAVERGYFQSDQRGTIVDWEGTNAGLDAATARSYIPGQGEPAVIVRLRVEPDDDWFTIGADDYLRTRKRIPLDRVEAVSDPMRMGVDPDSRYGRRRLERQVGGSPEPPEDFQDDTVYYHGTVMTDYDFDEFQNQDEGELIQPARVHGNVIFTSDTDPDFAYVTTELSDAWHYAELAATHRATGRPRVFQVQATGPVEPDVEFTVHGQRRGIMSHDLRSRHPFQFVQEMEAPEHLRAYDDEGEF